MIVTVIVLISLIALLIVFGVILSMGKGASLIAGYNTMPKKEKEEYDEKALCKFMGKFTLSLTIPVFLMLADVLWTGHYLFVYGNVLLVLMLIFVLIYSNTGNRFKNTKR